ncbi:MAG: nucleoside deaminase [Bacteroidetes bacterium]|nr:nucleoside deaminase [Bacteroidota bacterium]
MTAHEKFMRMAIALSRQNVEQGAGGPFGAVIVKNGKVVAQSANQVVAENDPTAHAEISAIRLACKQLGVYDLNGCTIYTSCEPCPMCLGAIYWAKLDAVYYANSKIDASSIGFDDNFIYEELGKQFHQRRVKMVQLLRNEALVAFKLWKDSESKTGY